MVDSTESVREVVPVDTVNAYTTGDGETICVSLRTGDGWETFRLPVAEADHLQGMLYLLVTRYEC